ncbi:tRNA lysidine(34) synthetase TilS [Roseococcus thiosulfatophilus]|uniref:tRNA lysidine(34) synthetase TilS n=1 Tax=Roseococcus thiosulfatophilus TaxID=35813 RepID=UPI001A9026E6|nr:tRNA lysidine(34) synthetase TilS [Roseococcus thiosulfatophilus]
MAPLGPFVFPIAIACSGGPDSLALTWLAHRWAGGRAIAFIVDHGLRDESADEAAGVAAQLSAHGIAARVLTLRLPGGAGLQARARAARRAALLEASHMAGAVHLLLGHHARDQAETIIFRALRGSGARGLAGMAPLSVAAEALLLRPLLDMPASRLAATCAAAGLRPVTDPSNTDPRFARARLRQVDGLEAVLAAAPAFAARREREEAAVLARAVTCLRLLPEGCAFLDRPSLGRDATARALLAALVRMVGGRPHAPAAAAVARLLAAGQGSLGGAVWRAGWLAREVGGPSIPAQPGALWDGRFRLPRDMPAEAGQVAALGAAAAARLRARHRHLPSLALAALPAMRGGDAMLAKAAHLPYRETLRAGLSAARFMPIGGPLAG